MDELEKKVITDILLRINHYYDPITKKKNDLDIGSPGAATVTFKKGGYTLYIKLKSGNSNKFELSLTKNDAHKSIRPTETQIAQCVLDRNDSMHIICKSLYEKAMETHSAKIEKINTDRIKKAEINAFV